MTSLKRNALYKIQIKLNFVVILVLSIFLVSCSAVSEIVTPKIVSLTATSQIYPKTMSVGAITSASQIVPNVTTPSPIQGVLFVDVYSGIIKINLPDNDVSTIIQDDDKVISAMNIKNGGAFFLKTTPSEIGFGPNEIYKLNFNDGEVEQLTKDGIWKLSLTSSPNHQFLAYVSDSESAKDRYKMQIINLKSRLSSIIAKNSDQSYLDQSWSPDSSRLVFFEEIDNEKYGKLYLYNLVTSQLAELLTQRNLPKTKLAWSPDGKKLALGIVENQQPGIYIFDLDLENCQKVIDVDEIPENLQWSPDGKGILFEFTHYASMDNRIAGLYLLDLSTLKVFTIQRGGIDGKWYSYQARWSNNNQDIEYLVNDKHDIWNIWFKDTHNGNSFELNLPTPINGYPESWVILDQ